MATTHLAVLAYPNTDGEVFTMCGRLAQTTWAHVNPDVVPPSHCNNIFVLPWSHHHVMPAEQDGRRLCKHCLRHEAAVQQ